MGLLVYLDQLIFIDLFYLNYLKIIEIKFYFKLKKEYIYIYIYVCIFFFFLRNKHTHIGERKIGSNTKIHHNPTQNVW